LDLRLWRHLADARDRHCETAFLNTLATMHRASISLTTRFADTHLSSRRQQGDWCLWSPSRQTSLTPQCRCWTYVLSEAFQTRHPTHPRNGRTQHRTVRIISF